MRRSRVLPAIVLAALTMLIACTKGDECDKCSSDSDCDAPLVCRNFTENGQSVGKRCASGAGATTCRVLK